MRIECKICGKNLTGKVIQLFENKIKKVKCCSTK